MRLLLLLSGSALLCNGAAIVAFASQQFSHQRNVLPGGRAAMLGGAYTALADDPSGSFYNPAGLSFARNDEIALSGNAYHTSTTTYERAVNGENFVENSSSLYPSFVGSNYRWRAVTFGYSYMTLDSRNVNQDHNFTDLSTEENGLNTYTRTNQETGNNLIAGGSAALALGDTLSVGTSLFYSRRTVESTTHQMTQANGGGLLVSDFKYQTRNEGIMPVLGTILRGKTASIGLSARIPQSMSDHTTVSADTVLWTPPADGQAAEEPDVTSFAGTVDVQKEPNPETWQLGLAWFPGPAFLATGDILFHRGVEASRGILQLEDTFNWSVGLESRLSAIVFRAGAFSNNSMFRKPSAGGTDQPTWINFLGTSAGIGYVQRERESSIGFVHQAGRGKSQIVAASEDIQDVETTSTTWMLSSRVFF